MLCGENYFEQNNDGRPSFLLWLRLRLLVGFEKEFEGAASVILRWISSEL